MRRSARRTACAEAASTERVRRAVAPQLARQRARAEERRRAHGHPLRRRVTIADLPEDPHESPFDDEADEAERGADAKPATMPNALPCRARRPTASRCASIASHGAHVHRRHAESARLEHLRTAVVLGVERTNLHKKIRAYGIKRGEG